MLTSSRNLLRQATKILPIQATAINYKFARQAPHRTPFQSDTRGEKYTPTKEEERIMMDTAIPKGPTADELITKDASLNSFMAKIYTTTGLSVASSLGISYLLATSPLVYTHPFLLTFGGLAASITGIIAFNAMSPIIKREYVSGQLIERWENSIPRKLAFATIIAGSGVMISPFMNAIMALNPGIIPMAVGLSFLVMGGSSIYSLKKPLGHFKTWESTLAGGLIGLVGMNLLSILFHAIMGPNVFSYACSKVDLYIGLGLFSAFQAFDTQKAVRDFRSGRYDHLTHVISFFLNFKNLFVRIVEILARNSRD